MALLDPKTAIRLMKVAADAAYDEEATTDCFMHWLHGGLLEQERSMGLDGPAPLIQDPLRI